MNTVPKFSRVELIIKNPTVGSSQVVSTELLEFEDCGLMITGDYIIVVLDVRDELKNSLSTTGNIFNLKDVIKYRTHTI